MRLAFTSLSLAVAALAGCAVQTPAEQVNQAPTVRLCTGGGQCSEQPRNITTFQGEPVNAESERRMAALTALAERDPKAAYDLGLRLLRGDGVERNTYQAIEWMRKAGDRGHATAQFELGRMYLVGVEEMGPDPAEAETWLARAAARGNKEAARLLTQARAGKQDAQGDYQARKDLRESWYGWYINAPYYWVWGPSGWYLR